MYHILYQPLSNISALGLILESRIDMGCDTDFAINNYHPKSVHGPFSHEKRYAYNFYHFSVQYHQCFLFWTQLRTDPLQSMTAVTICMFSHCCWRRTFSPSAISISFAWIISSAIPFFSASRSQIFLVHVLWIIEWSVKNSPYFPLKYHFRQNISRIRMSRCSIHGKILGLLILPIPLLHFFSIF